MCDHNHNDEDYKQLINAVIKSRIDCVTTLIKQGAAVNMPREYFKVAFSFAIENWEKNFLANDALWEVNFEILESLLIDSGSYVYNIEEERLLLIGMLNISAHNGSLRCLQKVLNAGVHPDLVRHSTEPTALMQACANGFLDCVNVLLQAGADVNIHIYSGMSILMYTAARGWHECVKALLQAAANVNFANSNGITALECAIVADAFRETIATEHEMKDRDSSLLVDQLWSNNSSDGLCVKVLIEGGADVNIQNKYGDTALMLAAQNNTVACINHILNAGTYVNLLNYHGQPVITMASKNGHLECVKKLIEAGADVNRGPLIKWPGETCCKTALMFAAKGGHTDCLKALLEGGADVNTLENNCKTALIYAAKGNHKDCIEILLQWGAAVNVWDDKHEMTALMQAAKNTTSECVDLLIQAAADVNERDRNGKTASMYAAAVGNYECIDSLCYRKGLL